MADLNVTQVNRDHISNHRMGGIWVYEIQIRSMRVKSVLTKSNSFWGKSVLSFGRNLYFGVPYLDLVKYGFRTDLVMNQIQIYLKKSWIW